MSSTPQLHRATTRDSSQPSWGEICAMLFAGAIRVPFQIVKWLPWGRGRKKGDRCRYNRARTASFRSCTTGVWLMRMWAEPPKSNL